MHTEIPYQLFIKKHLPDQFTQLFLIHFPVEETVDMRELFRFFHPGLLVGLAEHLETPSQAFVADQFIYKLAQFIFAQAVIDVSINVLQLFDLCHLTLFCLV